VGDVLGVEIWAVVALLLAAAAIVLVVVVGLMRSRRAAADVGALIAAIAVLGLGAVLVLVPSFRKFHSEIWKRDPFSVRLVTSTVTRKADPGRTVKPATTTVTRTRTTGPTGRTTEVTIQAAPRSVQAGPVSTTTTTTTNEANDSLLERALSTGGLLLFRLAIVAFAAFIAGAVVQRAILGRYSLKLGVLEFDDIQSGAEEAVKALTTRVTELGEQEKALTKKANRDTAATKKAILALSAQVDALRLRLPPDGGA
jgi:FAD/FMN-containing dehydrogenase